MISIAIITYNEEKNIRSALESVKWADEIVVVDSFSTDRTQEICREYTDKVIHNEFSGYADQKSVAVSMTTQPWVFVLDADERVTDGLRDEIIDLLKSDPSKDGYYVARKNYFGKRWIRHGGWWPDHTLRLFRREKGTFKSREVHERVVVDGETGYLKNPIEHFTYEDVNDYMQRMQTYSTLSAIELFKKGRRSGILDIVFRPAATFCKMLLLRLGILDGIYGIMLAWLYSVYTYRKYIKLKEMNKDDKSEIPIRS